MGFDSKTFRSCFWAEFSYNRLKLTFFVALLLAMAGIFMFVFDEPDAVPSFMGLKMVTIIIFVSFCISIGSNYYQEKRNQALALSPAPVAEWGLALPALNSIMYFVAMASALSVLAFKGVLFSSFYQANSLLFITAFLGFALILNLLVMDLAKIVKNRSIVTAIAVLCGLFDVALIYSIIMLIKDSEPLIIVSKALSCLPQSPEMFRLGLMLNLAVILFFLVYIRVMVSAGHEIINRSVE